jgi:hypothetical protein
VIDDVIEAAVIWQALEKCTDGFLSVHVAS